MCEKEPKRRSCTECPQYDGMTCAATDMVLGEREQVLQEEHRRGFICLDTGEAELKGEAAMYWAVEQERLSQEKGYKSVEEMWAAEVKQVKSGVHIDEDNEQLEPLLQISNDPGPVKLTFQYEEKEPGSPSSECPSRRDGPPQKGKIAENKSVHNSQHLSVTRSPDDTCGNCKKSHTEGGRLVCDKWGLQNILMPYRLCAKWALDPLKVRAEEQKIHYAEGSGLAYVENPPPLFNDPNGFWEPVRPRSCTNCKLYNDPICMKMASHIGKTEELREREEKEGFKCYAALSKEEYEAVITSIGCNSRKEIR